MISCTNNLLKSVKNGFSISIFFIICFGRVCILKRYFLFEKHAFNKIFKGYWYTKWLKYHKWYNVYICYYFNCSLYWILPEVIQSDIHYILQSKFQEKTHILLKDVIKRIKIIFIKLMETKINSLMSQLKCALNLQLIWILMLWC